MITASEVWTMMMIWWWWCPATHDIGSTLDI